MTRRGIIWVTAACLGALLIAAGAVAKEFEPRNYAVAPVDLNFVALGYGFWWALAAGYGYGGRTYVNGEARATIQRNWRIAAMVAYPITPTQGISVTVATGQNQGAGTDSDGVRVAYQHSWGGG